MERLFWDDDKKLLKNAQGLYFQGSARSWAQDETAEGGSLSTFQVVDAIAGLTLLQRESKEKVRAPVGVIGPRNASERQYHVAYELGRALSELGLNVICGGKGGVMEAVCKGVYDANGLCIGLLPDAETDAGNDYVGIPLATGIGIARNAILARASVCLISVGGGLGTLSEIALGLQFGKAVFGIENPPSVEGMLLCNAIRGVLQAVAFSTLNLSGSMNEVSA